LRAQLGLHTLADVTPALGSEYRDRLAAGLTPCKEPRAPATVNRYLAVVSHLLTITIEWEWVDDNPFRKVRKLKELRGPVRFLADSERPRLLEACRASRTQIFIPLWCWRSLRAPGSRRS